MIIISKEIAIPEGEFFKFDDGNVTFKGNPIFEVDGDGNLYITETGTEDYFWQVDEDNNITPKF